jgi:hypothetical protein
MVNNRKQKNIILSIIMLLAFCYPIFTIFNKPKFIGNIPLLYIYVIIAWLLAIILLVISSEIKPSKKLQKGKDE